MAQTLQWNNLAVPKNARKKVVEKPPDDQGKRTEGHALVVGSSSSATYILDSGASNHMAASQESFTSFEPCTSTPILMGDDTLVSVCGKASGFHS
jgi:hypothetical protein